MSIGVAEKSSCKRQNVALNEQSDRISSLPDGVLAHILSFLPTKDAVNTVLIRRFGNLWTSISILDFDVCLYHECDELTYDGGPRYEKQLINFIHHVLILHEHPSIHRFRLCFEFFLWYSRDHFYLDNPEMEGVIEEELELASKIDTWIRFALRKKVKVLDLDFRACGYFDTEDYHKLPDVVLASDFLTELNLVFCRVEPRDPICLQSLKTLALSRMLISDKTMIEMLSGCPVLENLSLNECYGLRKLNFTSLNLKNVVIELNRHESSRLEISCPYVTSLNVTGIERLDPCNVSSIVDATLEFNSSFNCARGEYDEVKVLFEQFYNAEVFTMFTRIILLFTIWELIRSSCAYSNWRRLVLKTMLTKWHLPGIACLLRNSPDLEMLDIHIQPGSRPFCYHDDPWLRHYELDGEYFWDLERCYFHCLRCHLKTIGIRDFRYESCAIQLVQFLLRKACILEKLVIETERDVYPDEQNLFMFERLLEISKDLQCFPRASPQAVILFS